MKTNPSSLKEYIDFLQSRGNYWLFRRGARKALNLSPDAFKVAAHRLIKKGRLQRVRGEFYIIVPLEYQAINTLPPTWFIDAFMAYLEQKYYVGLLSAAALHSAAHQQPMVFQVMTDQVTREIVIGKLKIQFIYKKNIKDRFYQEIKTETGMMHVATPEITACDLIRYMDVSGQVNHVATVLYELSEQIQVEQLARLVSQGDIELSVAQRLGYLLEILSLPIDLTLLEQAVKNKKPSNRWLVTKGKSTVILDNKKWHILVNEIVEIDEL